MVTITPDKLRIVPDAKGKPAGVMMDMQTWEAIMEALEMADDLPVIRKALGELRATEGNRLKSGFVSRSKAKNKLKRSHAKKQA
jgi:hypothetical protein